MSKLNSLLLEQQVHPEPALEKRTGMNQPVLNNNRFN